MTTNPESSIPILAPAALCLIAGFVALDGWSGLLIGVGLSLFLTVLAGVIHGGFRRSANHLDQIAGWLSRSGRPQATVPSAPVTASEASESPERAKPADGAKAPLLGHGGGALVYGQAWRRKNPGA